MECKTWRKKIEVDMNIMATISKNEAREAKRQAGFSTKVQKDFPKLHESKKKELSTVWSSKPPWF